MTPITELNLEKGTYDLFNEWLKTFFDGSAHDVGGTAAVAFPKASLVFGQGAADQPLNPAAPTTPPASQVSISMVLSRSTRTSRRWAVVGGVRQEMFYTPTRFNFWIRAEGGSVAGSNAKAQCMTAAQLLTAILGNPATARALAQNGVRHLRPLPPEPVAEAAFVLRLVACQATLRYAVASY